MPTIDPVVVQVVAPGPILIIPPVGTTSGGGSSGTDGTNGWSPIFALVTDGARRVLQVEDWAGGTGSKPTVGQYVGATGLVTLIASAVDVRGAAGADGTGTPGTNGTNGATWRDGTGAPSNGLGANGDYYLNDATGDVYLRSAGIYGVVANIKGAQGAQGAQGIAGGGGGGGAGGYSYAFNSATAGDPGSGKFLFNNATFGSATTWSVSTTDGIGQAIAAVLAALDDTSGTNKAQITIVKGSGAFFTFYITSNLTDNSTYYTFNITPIGSAGSIVNTDAVSVFSDIIGSQDNKPFYISNHGDPVMGIPDQAGPSNPTGGLFLSQRLWASPFLLEQTTKFIGVTAAPGATLTSSPKFWFGLFTWDMANGKPLVDVAGVVSGLVTASTKLDLNFPSPVILPPGVYCQVFLCDKSGSQSSAYSDRKLNHDLTPIYTGVTWSKPRVYVSSSGSITSISNATVAATAWQGANDVTAASAVGQSETLIFFGQFRYQKPF